MIDMMITLFYMGLWLGFLFIAAVGVMQLATYLLKDRE
jgi:hypothetical protein